MREQALEPGVRIVGGRMLYSAAWLGEEADICALCSPLAEIALADAYGGLGLCSSCLERVHTYCDEGREMQDWFTFEVRQ